MIGLSGKFPGSADYQQYWRNLSEGEELIKTFTDDELMQTGVSEKTLASENYVKSVGIVNNKDHFDPGFFGYSVLEATLMDPQIRIFHQQCWAALEDSGNINMIEKKKVGLFAGASTNEDWKIHAYASRESGLIDPFFLNMITSNNFICSLISYKLNLRGPSVYLDTACSTSLMAVHLACRSLLMKECTIALAGGISLKSKKEKGYRYIEGMIASKDGKCRAFDADASGTAAGEGSGVVVLKRLSEAIKDRDHIYGVILSTSANNDGSQKVGYTAPSVNGQAECIKSAQKLADIDPKSISYVETHGTGTRLGDPIEIRALNEAFSMNSGEKSCAIGSVKTNIGHADTAAGIAGLIKTILCLENKQIPPSLNFKNPNPEIDFDKGPFYVNTKLSDWGSTSLRPLRAGVSSFGIGGTNVHTIVEEAPAEVVSAEVRKSRLLVLSAKTDISLHRYLEQLKLFLENHPRVNLDDMAYTLQTGRKHFSHRMVIKFDSHKELISQLNSENIRDRIARVSNGSAIAFVFPGQGSQYPEMSKDLYEKLPLFREIADTGFSIANGLTGKNYRKFMNSDAEDDHTINDTTYTQPQIFIVEYALAKVMQTIGVSPAYMIGHSLGEYVAACISGVFSFEEGVALVVKRSEIMGKLPAGSMLSVGMSASEAEKFLNENISLAAINSPGQVVLSGNCQVIDELAEKLKFRGIAGVKLQSPHAFHSAIIESICGEYEEVLNKIQFGRLQIPFISNLSGEMITETDATSPAYWLTHMRETVLFSKGIKNLLSTHQQTLFIEIGAGKILTSLIKQHSEYQKSNETLSLIRSYREIYDDFDCLMKGIGQLWTKGVPIDWEKLYKNEERRKIPLPTYSFEPENYPAEVNILDFELLSGLGIGANKTGQGTENLSYFPIWKRSAPYHTGMATDKKGYLFFSAQNPFNKNLSQELVTESNQLVNVSAGSRFLKLSKLEYQLDPGNENDLKQLLHELETDNFKITDIICSCDLYNDDQLKEPDRPYRILMSTLKIIQVLKQEMKKDDSKFIFITKSLYKVLGHEKISFEHSIELELIIGIINTAGIRFQNIDIEEYNHTLTGKIAVEIQQNDIVNNIVAIRNDYRWYHKIEINKLPLDGFRTTLVTGGVYLVVGSAPDLLFVNYLLQKYNANIIFIGPDAGAFNIAEYLDGSGKNVTFFNCDIFNPDDLSGIVEDIELNFGHINGVIHHSDTIDSNPLVKDTDNEFQQSYDEIVSKVNLVQHIYDLFINRSPDFVLITSVATNNHLKEDELVNLYIPGFIVSASEKRLNIKFFNISSLTAADKSSYRGLTSQGAGEIVRCIECFLSLNDCSVIYFNHQKVNDLYQIPANDISDPSNHYTVHKLKRPELTNTYLQPVTATEKKLQSVFEEFMGIRGIGTEDNFFELGGDSLKGMMLLKRINMEFEVSLNLDELFKHVDIKGIASKIDEIKWHSSSTEMDNEITI